MPDAQQVLALVAGREVDRRELGEGHAVGRGLVLALALAAATLASLVLLLLLLLLLLVVLNGRVADGRGSRRAEGEQVVARGR